MLGLAYQRRVRQLQRKSRELRDMIETIPAMVWTARPDGSDPFVNQAVGGIHRLARLGCVRLDGRCPPGRSPGLCGEVARIPCCRRAVRLRGALSLCRRRISLAVGSGRAFSRCARKDRQMVWPSRRHRRPQACRGRAREAARARDGTRSHQPGQHDGGAGRLDRARSQSAALRSRQQRQRLPALAGRRMCPTSTKPGKRPAASSATANEPGRWSPEFGPSQRGRPRPGKGST